MIRTALRRRHGPEEGLWVFTLIGLIFFLTFVALILFVPR